MLFTQVHNAEVDVYEVFANNGAGFIPLPIIYGAKKLAPGEVVEPAYLIMQNMGEVAGHMSMTNMETLNDKQSEQV